MVSDGTDSNTTRVSFQHLHEFAPQTYSLIGPATQTARRLSTGDTVNLRVVDYQGNDSYIPQTPLAINASNVFAEGWPYELALAVNASGDGSIVVGTLNDNGEVVPVVDATANNIYIRNGAPIAGVFLNQTLAADPTPAPAPVPTPDVSGSCEVVIAAGWNSLTQNQRVSPDTRC